MKAPASQRQHAYDDKRAQRFDQQQQDADAEQDQAFGEERQRRMDDAVEKHGHFSDGIVDQLRRVTLQVEGPGLTQVAFEQTLRQADLQASRKAGLTPRDKG